MIFRGAFAYKSYHNKNVFKCVLLNLAIKRAMHLLNLILYTPIIGSFVATLTTTTTPTVFIICLINIYAAPCTIIYFDEFNRIAVD